MSGKGHYRGGGTIIGPHARWSDHAEFPKGEQPPTAEPPAKPGKKAASPRKLKSNERKQASSKAPAIRRSHQLTADVQRRLDLHRLIIRRLAAQIAGAKRDLGRERDQLRDLLVRHGLPTAELDQAPEL